MRTFIAIDIPEQVKRQLGELQASLRECGAPVAWVKPDNFHATLKFLGEVGEDRIEQVFEAVRKAVAGSPRCTFQLEGVGAFPSAKRPRVIWVGVGAGKQALVELAQKVDAELGSCGFDREARAYAPHFTLGRVKEPRANPRLTQAIEASTFASGDIVVGHVTVMQSKLNPKGSVYTPLLEVPLI